ncbi:SDR family NAD(P)-dependent oxidoreductase, partial [Candidatus Margulisiibacteriota bacterium]
VQNIYPKEKINPGPALIMGLANSMSKEYAGLKVLSIDIDAKETLQDLIPIIFEEKADKKYEEIAIRNNTKYKRTFESIIIPTQKQTVFKKNGTYAILGGTGGIGLEFSKYLAEKVGAKIALLDRSDLDDAKKAKIKEIEDKGGKVLYVKADALDEKSMQQAYQKIKSEFGAINGVLHSAIVLRDRTFRNMDEETLSAVLAPKVEGAKILAKVFGAEKLDFMLFFSSAQSFIGNTGQGNYTAACLFKDRFAQMLDNEKEYPVKIINWGYWGTVGVVAGEEYRKQLSALGIESIMPEEGMETIEKSISSDIGQIVAIKAKDNILQGMGVDFEKEIKIAQSKNHSLINTVIKNLKPIKSAKIDKFFQELKEVEHFSYLKLIEIFQNMGAFKSVEEKYTQAELKNKIKMISKYDKLLDSMLYFLTKNGYLELTEGAYSLKNKFNATGLQKQELLAKYPEMKHYLNILLACFQGFQDILQGKIMASEIIFQNSSMELVEGIYKNNTLADYFNEIVAASADKYIELAKKADNNKKIRILEIGSGSGGTSAPVLAKIAKHSANLEYIYTDISIAFTKYGREQYGTKYDFMDFKILNIEKDMTEQGFKDDYYDIILATNVLHATADIRNTIKNVKSLLNKNGIMLLNEVTSPQIILTLTFGLLDGWWLYNDNYNRMKGGPVLSTSLWQKILQEEGIEKIAFAGQLEKGQNIQNVITCESNGLISRQKKAGFVQAQAQTIKPIQKTIPQEDNYVQNRIIDSISQVLKIDKDEFDINSPYTDFGVDSILAVEIINKINASLGIELRTTDLFNYSTIQKLTDYVTSTRPLSEVEGPLGHQDQLSSPSGAEGSKADVAIIGLSCQFPEAENAQKFWENLAQGKDSVTEVTQEKWNINKVCSNYKWAGQLSDVDKFDPYFFNISPKEAEYMDPQQRVFLMEAWNALEDAGYSTKELEEKKCGVYAGVGINDYHLLLKEAGVEPESYTFTGNSGSILAARISYYLNLRGPSIVIDTACSSSLVAIQMAYESIITGTCEMALAGGVAILNTPEFHILSSKTKMLSPEGKCKAFDNSADGFVPGEGVGIVVLKALDKAIADNDRIYGVIKGVGVNQDGKTNGITAPSAPSQTALECEVYDRFGISPETINYVETHGTGTKLGDPIEVSALTDAFNKYTKEKQFCALGSVKSNIGHTLTAAGVAGVIKVLLQMKHQKLAPSLHLKQVNEHIKFSDSPFFVNTKLTDWKAAGDNPRRAAVSSFGFSGTNAHVVLEEYALTPRPPLPEGEGEYVIVLSAKTELALAQRVKDLLLWLEKEGAEANLRDISYTLLMRRTQHKLRLAFYAKNILDLKAKLQAVLAGNKPQTVDPKDYEDILFQDCKCLELPSYPFTKERYWVPTDGKAKQAFDYQGIRVNTTDYYDEKTTAEDIIPKVNNMQPKINEEYKLRYYHNVWEPSDLALDDTDIKATDNILLISNDKKDLKKL